MSGAYESGSTRDEAAPAGSAGDELTEREHWDHAWEKAPRWRLPSGLFISTLNLQRLVRRYVTPGARYIELGCAPGKMLAWTASVLEADVSGLDYSQPGIDWSRELFARLGLRGDLRCEDVFKTTFPAASFDVVFSAGLIEHFDDPRPIVRAHVDLARPGGRVVITVPNYGGIYGRAQGWLDPENLALHNLQIMNLDALRRLAPDGMTASVRTYAAGRISPWLLSIARRFPRPIATGISLAVNTAALAQPFDVEALCPMLVLEIVRGGAPAC